MRVARTIAAGLLLIAVALATVIVVIRWAPERLADQSGLTLVQAAEERGRVRTGLLTFLGATLAAVGAAYTARTFALNRRGQATERFTRAVDQLGSDKPDVRLGGIYALEQLALDSNREHGPVMEVLTAYVRRRAALRATDRGPAGVDVQAVVTVLGRRDRGHEQAHSVLFDMSATNLAKIRAEGLVLRRALLSHACLDDAMLMRADLREAGLVATGLERATLRQADLRKATLRRARLHGANLDAARLDGAELRGATYDDLTVWPQGFDADAAGAERVL